VKRLQRSALVAMLADELKAHGSWSGETHLQKAAFLLQEALGVPLGYDFTLYKHGPFSFELRDDVHALRADGLLTLEPRPQPYGPTIVTTPRTELLEKRFPETRDRYASKVAKVAELVGPKGVISLERVATAFLLMRRHPDFEDAEVALELRRVKPHISEEGAAEAIAIARKKILPILEPEEEATAN
jgi:hypothetical protein